MDFPAIIQDFLGEFNFLAEIKSALERDKKITISDLSFCAKSLVIALISGLYPDKKIFVLTPSSIEAQKFWRNLDIMLGRHEVFNIENVILGKQFPESEIKAILEEPKNKIFVASLQNCYRELINKKDFEATKINFKIGQHYNISDLTNDLIKIGYISETKVFAAGSFSRRGDVLDIFSPNWSYPARFEFLDSKLEKIYFFDSLYQTLIERIEQATILPVQGIKEMGAIFSWFSNTETLLVLDGSEEVFTEMFNTFTNRQSLASLARLEQDIKKFIQINLETFARSNSYKLGWSGVPRIPDFDSLVNDLKFFNKNKYRIIISTASPENLIKELQEKDISAKRLNGFNAAQEIKETILVDDLKILDGIRADDQKIIIISDLQLVGEAEITRSEKSDFLRNIEGLLSLSEGDIVVHVDHGIGQFERIDKIKIGEIEREYIFLHFAGEDRLYVPVEQADKITKYVSVTKDLPELSRLGGEAWKRIREQAKKTTWILAKELLETQALRETKKGFSSSGDEEEQKLLASTFAYRETPDQANAIKEVLADMAQLKPMDRLVCADVGYGKTEVAIRAAVRAAVAGRQVALLAPTTILVDQHEETFKSRLVGLPIRVESISRFKTTSAQQDIIAALAAGEIDIIIGTHRLLSRDVKFKNLGLVIIDEEHRFGVRHKEKLKQYRAEVDVLSLTATPIPRTLHMALSGLRDISTINTAPSGRLPIKTRITIYDEKVIKDVIERELERGGQVYFVHNRVQTIEVAAEKIMLSPFLIDTSK